MRKRITQADIAREANVSQAMVSYVVNDVHHVNITIETRQKVKKIMNELGYVPNISAQRLKSKKTNTIAGIIPDITNPFYPEFERGIQEIVDSKGYDFIVYNTDASKSKEKKCIGSLLQGRVDGLIGVFFHLNGKELKVLVQNNISVLRLEGRPKKLGDLPIDNIFVDNISASKFAVDYLLKNGHQKISMISSEYGPSCFREIGYEMALTEAGIERKNINIIRDKFDENGGYQAAKKILSTQEKPTAIFAANDLIAMGAMVAIREEGIAIPNDISVVGFDDVPSAKLVSPALTTVSQFQRNMGRKAAELLLQRINKNPQERAINIEMPFELVVRDSTIKRSNI
jgi:LacI family transcriptional regulator